MFPGSLLFSGVALLNWFTESSKQTIFKQTFTKLIVTKTQIPILTIIIPFYKLMLMIMKVLQKTHQKTKIRVTFKKKYHRSKKSQNAPPNEKETSKKITKKNKILSPECKGIYVIGDSTLKQVQGYEISKSLKNCKTYVKSFAGA